MFKGNIERIVMCSGSRPNTETNKRMIFEPGRVYTSTDPIAIKYIKGEIGDVREKMVANENVKSQLAYYNIPYDIKKCGTCVNSVPKAFFNPFEILEEETDEL